MRNAYRGFCATTQKRQQIAPRSCATPLTAPNLFGHCFGTVRERLGIVPDTLLDDSRTLWACSGRPEIAPGTALARPGPVTSASWSVFKTAWSVQNCPRSNFCPFLVNFGRLLVRFHVASFVRSIVLLIAPSFARLTFQSRSLRRPFIYVG